MNIQTEIIIDAPASTVWTLLTDLPGYADWNPFIVRSEGQVVPGARLRNTMRNGDRDITFTPRVLHVEPGQRFEWLGHLWIKGLFDGRHTFEVKALGPNRCQLTQGEHFSGLLSGLILRQIGSDTRQQFVAMNQALKARAEEQVREQAST
jgi:hypothetical protein